MLNKTVTIQFNRITVHCAMAPGTKGKTLKRITAIDHDNNMLQFPRRLALALLSGCPETDSLKLVRRVLDLDDAVEDIATETVLTIDEDIQAQL